MSERVSERLLRGSKGPGSALHGFTKQPAGDDVVQQALACLLLHTCSLPLPPPFPLPHSPPPAYLETKHSTLCAAASGVMRLEERIWRP